MDRRNKIKPGFQFIQIFSDYKSGGWNFMIFVKLFLKDLVFNDFEGGWPGIDLYPFSLQLLQSLCIHRFYFNGNCIKLSAKLINIIKVSNIPFCEVVAQMGCR